MAKDLPVTATAKSPNGKPDWAMSRRERRRAESGQQGQGSRRWRWLWFPAVLAVVAGAWLLRERLPGLYSPQVAEQQAPAAPTQPRLTQINQDEWVWLEPMTLRRTVKVIGPLRASRRADLAAETGGQVESVEVRTGDRVSQSQVLVRIDLQGLNIELDLARSNAEATRAQLALAEDQLDRQEELVERGVAAATTVNELSANVAALQANLSAQEDQIAAAELAVERATVRAPFDGVVASRSVEPGTVAAPGAPLVSVVDLEQMEMLASAPVSAGAIIRRGQEVTLEVDGVEGKEFTGTVERIAPVAEEGTRTLTVFVGIANEDRVLLGGMFATGEIVVEEAPETLALPRDAIRNDGGEHVLVIEDEGLVRRDVQVGPEWPGGIVQVTGISAGQRVVTVPLSDLRAGEPVELVEF